MFSIQQLSEKIADVSANRLDVDGFEEWFVSESWGYYDVRGDQTSRAIAAVHHVLHSCEANELKEAEVAEELANAIRPFEVTVTRVVWLSRASLFLIAQPPTPSPRPTERLLWSRLGGRVQSMGFQVGR